MATALDTIKRSLRMIGELAAETGEAPNAAAAEQALATLNAMLAGWEHKGVRLGLDTLSLTSTIPLPPSHDNAIAFGLAVELAIEYGADVAPGIAARAADEFAALQATYAFSGDMAAPLEYLLIGRV